MIKHNNKYVYYIRFSTSSRGNRLFVINKKSFKRGQNGKKKI